MFPFGSRPSPPPRLPRPVPPFPGETTGSYVYRLARANQLHPPDLRAHLAGRREHGPVALDALAAATGRPRHALAWALPELRSGAGRELSGYVRRTVCWRCAARRDSHPYAAVWRPAEICLCLSHRIWLGSTAHPRLRQQYDVAGMPEIIQAQGRHSRLARRRGRQAATTAIAEASRITALWARHGFYRDRRIPLIRELRGEVPITGKLPSSDNVTAVVTYPETVDLARILAMPRWRTPATATASDFRQFEREVRSRTGIEYAGADSRYDPLFRWFQKHREASSPAGQGEFTDQESIDLPQL
jgi:TniQ